MFPLKVGGTTWAFVSPRPVQSWWKRPQDEAPWFKGTLKAYKKLWIASNFSLLLRNDWWRISTAASLTNVLPRNPDEFGLTEDETMFVGSTFICISSHGSFWYSSGGFKCGFNRFITAMTTDSSFLQRLWKQLEAVCDDAGDCLERWPRTSFVQDLRSQRKHGVATSCGFRLLRSCHLTWRGVNVLIQDD